MQPPATLDDRLPQTRPVTCKAHIQGAGSRRMEAIAGQVPKRGGSAEGRTGTARQRNALGGAGPSSLPPLPQRGERLTEDQVHERFGVPKGGGVRESSTSSDIVLVRSVHSGCDDTGGDGRIIHDGEYYEGRPDQMILENLKLARSRESGSRVLYFVKDGGSLVFDGLVECVARRHKDASARLGALSFELVKVGASPAAAHGHAHGGRRGGETGLRGPSAPDLDMIMAVEHQISDRGSFAGRSELLAALPAGIDSAGLDRILAYLEHSAKISMDRGAISWSFNGAGLEEDSHGGKNGEGLPDAAPATDEPIHILSTAERLSPDLDNDLPYSPEIEQAIADCEAGRPIGKTYTIKEYLQHLDREFGNDAVDRSTD